MRFWESRLGALAGVLLLAAATLVVVVGVRVHLTTHPPRRTAQDIDFDALLVPVHAAQFAAVDGVSLSGWLLEGDAGVPAVVLCHDLGEAKGSLLHLAIDLHGRGHTVLLFDFRGHGASGGEGSTLGVLEKRDVVGALDYLEEREVSGRVGIYAVGMGAHAAVLAAGDRPGVRVLVLEGLYPDAAQQLARKVFAGWQPAVRRLEFLSRGLFGIMSGAGVDPARAGDALSALRGRDVLLLAPASDPAMVAAMQRMAESVPDQPDADGNLVVLPATHSDGLYGADLDRHREQVARFFSERLVPAEVAAAGVDRGLGLRY